MSVRAVPAFKVTMGEYDDRTYYIVRVEDAKAQVAAWYRENYHFGPEGSGDCWDCAEAIEIKKGVTRL